MPIPQFTVYPSTLTPLTFAADMDTFLSEMSAWIDAVNVAGAGYGFALTGTSTTSLTIATGSHSLTTETDLGFVAGMDIKIASQSSPSNYMLGTVTSYNAVTGALVVDVGVVGGSGTLASWHVFMTVPVSFDGQTYTNLILNGKITEGVYALSGTDIDPANGSIQTKTLSTNTTFTESLADGQSVVLILTAAGYTVTWPTINWLWGSAPTLPASGKAHIVLYQVGGTLYGVLAGTTT